jgi:hypothetical protein
MLPGIRFSGLFSVICGKGTIKGEDMNPRKFTTAKSRRLSQGTDKKNFRFFKCPVNSEVASFQTFLYLNFFSVFSAVNF